MLSVLANTTFWVMGIYRLYYVQLPSACSIEIIGVICVPPVFQNVSLPALATQQLLLQGMIYLPTQALLLRGVVLIPKQHLYPLLGVTLTHMASLEHPL